MEQDIAVLREEMPLLKDVLERNEENMEASSLRMTISERVSSLSVLPISFLAALGMAATGASCIFAYASLLCKDPIHCRKSEQSRYAGCVALAVSISNVCSLLVLGSLERLTKTHQKVGLAVWIICRTISVIILALGVHFKSISIAISGRVFEGFASDNMLHFNLNTVYVRNPDKAAVSQLIGTSLALFMIGISISPAVAGLFQNFATSFFMAVGIFSVAFLYLVLFVGRQQAEDEFESITPKDTITREHPENLDNTRSTERMWPSLMKAILPPLGLFYRKPASTLSGLALLIHNAVQSYVFSSIMVHTSLVEGFSSKQNGQLLSIVHAVSATYLFLVLFGIPALHRRHRVPEGGTDMQYDRNASGKRNAVLALVSLVMQIVSLVGFAKADKAWEIYVISACLALGLAAPSFIKSQFLGFFPRTEAAQAIGALAMMETLGALFSPLVLGLWQALMPGEGVFYGAACMVLVSTILFGMALVLLPVF